MKKRAGGMTLAELLIAVAIISIGALALVDSFTVLARSVLGSKSRTIAVNLAQEKLEYLKNLSYHRLLPTATVSYASESGLGSFPYDTAFYPEESLTVGDVQFKRRTYVTKVQAGSGGSLTDVAATSADTGLKRITVYVIWEDDNEWKKLDVVSLHDDPNRQALSGSFIGVVQSTGGADLQNAKVEVIQNPSWFALTGSDGSYSFSVTPGSYTLRASLTGYFSSTSATLNVTASNSPLTQSFALPLMGTGTIRGTAWINDHLVISQVVGSTQASNGFFQEYVELFNPTTYTWTISNGAGLPVINLKYQRRGQGSPTTITMDYNVLTAPASSYYLLANTATVVAAGVTRTADAVFQASNSGFPNLIDVTSDSGNDAAGVGIAWNSDDTWIDQIGWKKSGNDPPIYENVPFYQNVGLETGEQFVRFSSTGGPASGIGRAYDSGDNSVDFDDINPIQYPPRSTSDTEPVVSGAPADGAFASANDGLSLSGQAVLASTSPAYALFTIPRVATGTWSVIVASGTYMIQTATVSVVALATTTISNSATEPPWQSANYPAVRLSSSSVNGFVSGQVTNISGTPLSAIKLTAGGSEVRTGSNGRYVLSVASGTYDVWANFGNDNASYVSESSSSVTIELGRFTPGVDFTLAQGGGVRGFIRTAAANDALPGVPVIVTLNDVTMGEAVSGSDGYFTVMDLSTGTYIVEPQVDTGETVSPSTTSVTVVSGATTFASTYTVTNAMGLITGEVATLPSTATITTGVLIVATTSTITSTPPDITSSVRSGSQVYYAVTSLADGTYELSVRGGPSTSPLTYNVYAWYTTYSGETPTTVRKATTASVISGDTTPDINFSW